MLCVQLAELVCEGLECGIVEEGELLGACLKISRVHAISSVSLCLLLVDEDIVSQLLLKQHISWPHAVFPTMVLTNLKETKIKGFLSIHSRGHAVLSQKERHIGNKHESRYKKGIKKLFRNLPPQKLLTILTQTYIKRSLNRIILMGAIVLILVITE